MHLRRTRHPHRKAYQLLHFHLLQEPLHHACELHRVNLLAPRIGYLPLLISLLKPHFSTALPPGVDTIWFEYKGLPLKWYIPTGVLFDLLCVEPERPWNLTIKIFVHFRGYPSNLVLPCEGEDNVKWSFINSLKEVSCVISCVCASNSDGTCLINNMILYACSTFQIICLCTKTYAFSYLLKFAYTNV
uniref:Autophagy protein 5 n=1 Tax=Cajanus cajan TaxID=3821 RepID=A0A151UIC4_CAJCA